MTIRTFVTIRCWPIRRETGRTLKLSVFSRFCLQYIHYVIFVGVNDMGKGFRRRYIIISLPMFEHCNISSSRLLVRTDRVDLSRLSHDTLNFVEFMQLHFFGENESSALLSLSDVIVLLSFPSSELHDDMDFDRNLQVKIVTASKYFRCLWMLRGATMSSLHQSVSELHTRRFSMRWITLFEHCYKLQDLGICCIMKQDTYPCWGKDQATGQHTRWRLFRWRSCWSSTHF